MIFTLLLAAPALAIDRAAALDNAAAYAIHSWSMGSVNMTASCSSDYESTYSPGTYIGLPYDWGGYMDIAEFDAQIADGYGAGSHSWHGSLSCTAGLDCSGFVSMVWETGHYSTSTFYGCTDEIGWNDLKRADAVNDAGSHMVLFAYENDAGDPVFYEAAGSAERTRINSGSGWSYFDGYVPIRFEDIDDGAPEPGQLNDPYEIPSFPFYDQRWTAGALSDEIDSYSCAPDTDESGPEVLYHFVAAEAGRLEVVVSDDTGVDIDIHVLTAPSGDACIARDDTEVSVDVGPGDVWISLDTWVSGQEYPGPYLLVVDFNGGTGEPVEDSPPPEDDTAPDDDTLNEEEVGGTVGPEGSELGDDAPGGPGELSERPGGCGCDSGGPPLGLFGLLGALLGLRRRGANAGRVG